MEIIADILLVAGALGAAFYCLILSRRLKRFNSLEQGVGGAVAVLSAQVDDLNKSLSVAQETASNSAKTLTDLTVRAEGISKQLELQMASLHDIAPNNPVQDEGTEAQPAAFKRTPTTPASGDPAQPMFVRHNGNGGV